MNWNENRNLLDQVIKKTRRSFNDKHTLTWKLRLWHPDGNFSPSLGFCSVGFICRLCIVYGGHNSRLRSLLQLAVPGQGWGWGRGLGERRSQLSHSYTNFNIYNAWHNQCNMLISKLINHCCQGILIGQAKSSEESGVGLALPSAHRGHEVFSANTSHTLSYA